MVGIKIIMDTTSKSNNNLQSRPSVFSKILVPTDRAPLKKFPESTKLVGTCERVHPKGFLPYYLIARRRPHLEESSSRVKSLRTRNLRHISTLHKERKLSATCNESLRVESQWQRQFDGVVNKLREKEAWIEKVAKENAELKEIVKRNNELEETNRRLQSVLSVEQIEALDSLQAKKDFSSCLVTHGDVHVLYQNWYAKDLKDELSHLRELTSKQRIQIRMIEEKLEEANKEIANLKSKLKRCFVYFSSANVAETSVRVKSETKEPDDDARIKAAISLEVKKLQDVITFASRISKCDKLSTVCQEIIEYSHTHT